MTTPIYDNFEELLSLLQGVFSGDNDTIKKTEATLDAMAQDPIRLADSMIKVIINENSDKAFNEIKKAACIVISRKLSPLFDKKETPHEDKANILEAIITCLYSTNVIPSIKTTLQQVLIIIFHSDKDGVFKQRSIGFAIEKLGTQQINDYAASLLLIRAIMEDPLITTKTLAEWFVAAFEGLCQAGSTLIEGINAEIFEILKGSEAMEEKIAHIFIGLEVLKIWSQIIRNFIKRLGRFDKHDVENTNYCELVIDKEGLARLLLAVLLLNIYSDTQIKECIYSTSSLPQLDRLLNAAKTNILKCFEYILDYQFAASKTQGAENSPLLNLQTNRFYQVNKSSVLKALLQGLIQLSRSDYRYIEAGLKDKFFHGFLVESFILLTLCANFPDLYPAFAMFKMDIIIDVCLPIIATTREELELFKRDPQAFVNLTLGFNDEDETRDDSAKIQAIYLLKKICKNIDGGTSALLWVIGSLLEYSFLSNDIKAIQTDFPKLTEYTESAIIAAISPEIRVETCLLILAGTHQYILSRKDLMALIDKIFTDYHSYFLGPDANILTKTRMCLFLGFYGAFIFKTENNQPLFSKHLNFIIECAGLDKPQQEAISEQASQTLLNMLEETGSVYRMIPFVADVLEKLAGFIKTTNSVTLFEVIHQLIKIYHTPLCKSPKVIGLTMLQLVERAKYEYTNAEKDQKGSNLLLTRIFSIISTIGSQKEFIIQFQDDIETALSPLFSFLEGDEEFPLTEHILDYMTSAMKCTQKVSDTLWKLFSLIPKILDQERGFINSIFPVLNLIIVYGKDTIEGNEQLIRTFIDMGVKGLHPTHPDAGKAGPAMAALLFQVLIQYVGIPDNEWERMLVACLGVVEEDDKSFLKARLGGVFLLAFLRNFDLTSAVLVSQNALDKMLNIFVNQAYVFENYDYDRKVYLVGLCKFLSLPEPNPMVVTKLPAMLDILVSYLKYVSYIERKREAWKKSRKEQGYDIEDDEDTEIIFAEKSTLKDLLGKDPNVVFLASNEDDDYFYDSDDEEEDEEEEDEEGGDDEIYFPTQKDDVNEHASKLIAGIKDQDEFEVFNEAIQQLKDNNRELLVKLVQSLPDKKKQFMNDVLQSKRVVLNGFTGETQARKTVKARAKKLAQVSYNQ